MKEDVEFVVDKVEREEQEFVVDPVDPEDPDFVIDLIDPDRKVVVRGHASPHSRNFIVMLIFYVAFLFS